jgi:tetratricopeptide (TPR) repeat protein
LVGRPSAAADAWRARAVARTRLRRYAEALQDYGRALQLEPNDAATCAGRGGVYLACNSPDLALPDFEAAVELQRGQVAMHAARGWVQMAGLSPLLAVPDFHQAIRITAASSDAYNGLAFARVKLGTMYRQGVAGAETALQQGPRSAEVCYGAARVFAQAVNAVKLKRNGIERERYQSRAVALLHQAVDLVPAHKREAFWRARVQQDSAFEPIRGDPRFARLADYARRIMQPHGVSPPVLDPWP